MKEERIKEIIKQVLYNPQVSYPPVSYSITDKSNSGAKEYKSDYIDIGDFNSYIKRLEEQLVYRFTTEIK